MRRFIIIAMLVLGCDASNAQILLIAQRPKEEIDSFHVLLKKNIHDTIRVEILLNLADYYFKKHPILNNLVVDKKADFDSVAMFVRAARQVNARLSSNHWEGKILLQESMLARTHGFIDSARSLMNKSISLFKVTQNNEKMVEAMIELSLCYDPKEAAEIVIVRKLFNSVFQIVQSKAKDPVEVENCIKIMLHYYNAYMRVKDPVIQIDFLNLLLQAYVLTKDKEGEFWTRKEVADLHYKQGKLDQAISEVLQIVMEQKQGGYPNLCFSYDLLAGLYHTKGDYVKSLHYSLETIKHVKTAGDSLYLSPFYLKVAKQYSVTGSLDKAVEWNLKRLEHLIKRKNHKLVFTVTLGIVSDMIRLGKKKEALDLILSKSKTIKPLSNGDKSSQLLALAMCYDAVDNKILAEKYCNELIQLTELRIREKEATENSEADSFLAWFYLSIGQIEKAEKFFRKVTSKWPEQPSSTQLLYKSNFLFKLDSVKGNYLSAIKHLQTSKFINDSIFTTEKTKQMEELKVAYATEQKDSLIKLNEQNIGLLTKEDQLQKSKLRQGAVIRNISFAVVGLLAIIMGLLYNRYRLKQRTNQKLELQQKEIAKQNNSLQHLLNEKEWLLKEIHHRVKNNLQIVMSLLNSQSAYINNDAALTAIHDSQHRVHAMSLIHQKLYNSENLSSINLSIYVRELVSYLSESFDTDRRIRFDLDIELLEMDVSQAVPLGLILNEAITNSIKYAFPENRKGVISISLAATEPDHYLLSISDNGIGIHDDFNKIDSLGMSLMKGLSEDLDGDFSIENNNGTVIKISFVHDPGMKNRNSLAEALISSN